MISVNDGGPLAAGYDNCHQPAATALTISAAKALNRAAILTRRGSPMTRPAMILTAAGSNPAKPHGGSTGWHEYCSHSELYVEEATMPSGKKSHERVLVFGDDMRIFLAVVRSLGRAGKEVHAAPFNWHAPALKSRYISKVHCVPRYSDSPSAWCDAVLQVLEAHSFDLIVPCCDDRSLLAFHIHREEFAEYPIALPNPQVIDLLFDKELTRQACLELGIPVADGRLVRADDTAKGLASRFGLPLILKPRRSYWTDHLDTWGKVQIPESEAALQQQLSALDDPSRYLVESRFEGVGVGVSVLAQNGSILQAFQHRRLREGWGGASSYRISEPVDEDLHEACEKICRRVDLTGVCMFEFRWNPDDGRWILLETNARFWGSMPLPLSLGVDFPRFHYDLLAHGIVHAPKTYPAGVRSRNTVLDAFNLMAEVRRLRWSQIGGWIGALGDYLTQPLRWLDGRERSDSFVRDDLRPAFGECVLLLSSLKHRIVRSRGTERRCISARTSLTAAREGIDLAAPSVGR